MPTKKRTSPAPQGLDTPLRIIPLGGVGEIGKNMYVFEYGDDIVVIDCGLMFPDEEMFGIVQFVADLPYLHELPHTFPTRRSSDVPGCMRTAAGRF